MLEYGQIYILGLLLALALIPVFQKIGIALNWVDKPGPRKLHQVPMTDLGGAGIYLAFLVAAGVGLWKSSSLLMTDPRPLYGLFVGSLMVFLLGALDDRKGLSSTQKFLGLTAASLVLWAFGGRIVVLTNPFGDEFHLGIFSLPLTVIWLVGVSNAINLMDGLDGLAGGVAFMASMTLMFIALLQGEPVIAILMAALSGSILGFLKYNLPPASIFMGDAGALTLGFLLASTAVITRYKTTVAMALLIPLAALLIPIADTLFTILRRWKAGKPLFQADRGHLHHRLLDKGFTPKQIITIVYGIGLVLGLISISFIFIPKQYAFMILCGLALVFLVVLYRLESSSSHRK